MKKLMFIVLIGAALETSTHAQTAITNPQPFLNSAATASVEVTAEQVANMPPMFIGIKTGKAEFGKTTRLFTSNYTRAVQDFATLSPIAGQSCVLSLGDDGTKWVSNGAGQVAGEVSRTDIDALARFLEKANCKLDYSAAILKNTPQNAADELAYVESTVGENLIGVGFGNEPEGYGMTASQYATLWNTFAVAALNADNKLKFKGPETAVASNLGSWMTAWYQANAKLPLAYGSQHFYVSGPQNCPTCSIGSMLAQRTSNSYWNSMVLQKNSLEANLPHPLPVALTETNNFYSGGAPGISNSFASSLYGFDFVFRAAQSGFSFASFTEDDFWSKGYSPMNIINGYTYGPRFEYYGMYLAALAGYGPMLSTSVSGPASVHAYTVQDTVHGSLNTGLTNTSETNYSVTVSLPAGIEVTGCSAYLLSDAAGLADTAQKEVMLQGGEFNSSSQIEMKEAYGIPVSGGTARIALPAASALLMKCAVKSV